MKSFNYSDTLAYNKYETDDDIPSWSSVDKNSLGTFDSNGVFRLEPATSPPSSSFAESQSSTEKQNSFFSALEPKFSHSDNFQEAYNWYYCDPSNIIRGPFTSQEMQNWYKAGYFDPYLSVKREDAPGFETLTSLINRVGDAQNPFSTPQTARIFPENQKASFKLNYISDDNLFFPGVAHQAAYSHVFQHQPKEEKGFSYNKRQSLDNYAFAWQDNNKFPPQNDTFFSSIPQNQHQQQYVSMLRQNQQQQMLLQQKLFLEQYQQQQQQQLLPEYNQPVDLYQHVSQKTEDQLPASYLPDLSSNKTEEPVESNVQEKVETVINDQLPDILSSLHIDSDIVKPQTEVKSTTKKSEKLPSKVENNSHARSNTWSSASFKPTKLSPEPPTTLTPSQSTNVQSSKQRSNNAWNKPPVRQKHLSMTASIPPRRPQPTSSPVTKPPVQDTNNKKPSEDFIKWCKLSLRDLNPGVNGDEILQMLLSFPVDNSYSEIIQDIIYANSASLDGRRFANDFMTRRKQDMEGKKLNIALPTSAITTSEFKVVTKKGKKRH